MVNMYSLIGYYTGPQRQKGLRDHLFGREGSVVYLLNPQLYKAENPDPLRNFGVFTVSFGSDEPTPNNLEATLNAELKKALGVGIKVGRIIVPAENINISLEPSDE